MEAIEHEVLANGQPSLRTILAGIVATGAEREKQLNKRDQEIKDRANRRDVIVGLVLTAMMVILTYLAWHTPQKKSLLYPDAGVLFQQQEDAAFKELEQRPEFGTLLKRKEK